MGDQLPLWVGAAAAVGIPLLAFAGSVAGQVLSRRDALALDVRWRREETMRLLRWASELAVASEPGRVRVGVATMRALGGSELMQRHDQVIVDSVLDAVLVPVEDDYDEGAAAEEVD